jgi:isoquinoline 1-oxidoreductase beta subunit
MSQMSRRQLLFAGTAAGGGFLLGLHLEALPRALAATAERTQTDFAPNAFIRIGKDGQITLIMNQVEMGQGTYTSMSMLIAEELEVGLDQIHLEHAPPTSSTHRPTTSCTQTRSSANRQRAGRPRCVRSTSRFAAPVRPRAPC